MLNSLINPAQLSVSFFVQAAIIVTVARIVGGLIQKHFGQPRVVGEMIAGVLLGPSLFGLLAPHIQAVLFPQGARSIVYVIAQLGVGLYMFLVGLGFERDQFRSNAKSAAAVSIVGMTAPFALAIIITPWLLTHTGLFMPKVSQFQACLFMWSAMAITAFPMLARIIHERGLSGSALGTLSLSAGAMDDAGAWIIVAIILASFGDGSMVAIKAIAGGISFATVAIFFAPKWLMALNRLVDSKGELGHTGLAIALVLFLLSAFAMDAIGIHAVFGGFLLGTAMPRGNVTKQLLKSLEPITVVFLLPFFFVYSGLNTQLLMVNNLNLIMVTVVILVCSVLAKGVACYAAARFTGQDHSTAMGIGALMNARGLMELIIINIGLQRGIIGPALFSILVLMAIISTLMATPMFERFYGRQARKTDGGFGSVS